MQSVVSFHPDDFAVQESSHRCEPMTQYQDLSDTDYFVIHILQLANGCWQNHLHCCSKLHNTAIAALVDSAQLISLSAVHELTRFASHKCVTPAAYGVYYMFSALHQSQIT